MADDKPTIIILHETTLQSWASDTGSVVMLVVLIGIGWLLGSEAMQWVGAIIGMVWLIGKSLKDGKRMTIPQARAELDRIESGTP